MRRIDTLTRLEGALDHRKAADAQAMTEIRTAIADLEAEIRGVMLSVAAAAREVDPNDLAACAALDRYRSGQRARLEALARRHEGLLADEAAARERLTRSNGELEAVRRLMTAPPKP